MSTTNSIEGNPSKGLTILATIISIVIPLVVFILTRVKYVLIASPDVYILPKINAILNGVTTIVLLAALWAVKKKNIQLHARLVYLAMGISLLFLIGYITYHISTDATSYGGEGTLKTVYYILLASHIILAGLQTPFVLFAFVYGFTGQNTKHRKLVKFSYPIWLYVSITGVICYLMLAPYYPA